MIIVIARVRALPDRGEQLIAAFHERRDRVLTTEPDVWQYDLCRDAEAPLEFTFIERFPSRAHYQQHRESSRDHHRMMACFAAPPTITILDAVEGCAGFGR